MFNKLMSVTISIIIFLLILSLWGFYSAIRPFRIVSTVTPADYNVKYEKISFKTRDGILIRGWFVPSSDSKAKTIIVLHGYPADKGDILPSRLFLHPHYNLVFFDFRYLGESEGRYSTVGKNEVLDLLAAIEYLHSKGMHEVGVWGFSLGGAVALMTAPLAPEIKAIVAESSYARLDWMANDYYRLPLLRYPLAQLTRLWAWIFLQYDINSVSPATTVSRLNIPILIIHSKHDNVISYEHALLLEKSLIKNPHAKLITVEQLQHGYPMQDYQKIILDFFNENI